MGIPNSKISTDTKNDIVLAEVNLPSLTISTPQSIKSIDPRSPSSDIARTPIETVPIFLSECCLETPNNGDLLKISNDSNDTEINRTPVVIKQNSLKIDKDIRRKLLKDSAMKIITKTDQISALCDQIIESNSSEINTSLTDMYTPDKMKSKVGILETNIDYIETDVDQVFKKSHNIQVLSATPRDILHAKFKKQIENAVDMTHILELNDPRSPTVGIDRTPLQIIKPLDIDPRSPTLDFDRTPIQIPLKPRDLVQNIENFEHKLNSLCVTDSEDEEVIDRIVPVKQNQDNKTVLPKRNLIYEDNECKNTPKKSTNVKSNENGGRTPLGIRNGNGAHYRSKSANGRLHQHYEGSQNKNDLKSEYTVSKIPVFNKNVKKIRGKIQQCENTPPPNNLTDMKLTKRTQWDSADNTMII